MKILPLVVCLGTLASSYCFYIGGVSMVGIGITIILGGCLMGVAGGIMQSM